MLRYLIILILFCGTDNYFQTIHEIPFGSRNNLIELEIVNGTEVNLSGIYLEIKSKPDWLEIVSVDDKIDEIKRGGQKTAEIIFSVDKNAELDKEESMTIEIRNQYGVIEEKEIKIKAAPPKEYLLEQNYPNPFNPVTKIGYQIPSEGKITLIIYDILGRAVKVLFEGVRKPGYYVAEFNGANLSSGVYICSLKGNGIRIDRKMLLLK
ncbi:T9SS type A sorting domain-containing protein [Melioribacter sp. Ez-97]|jgi:hypothetical protein|uniref:T9SS type A sorting domain-containing protein n=1 Tax=Melioribacter sp. Ez-97 TaxID=3423434 RepID=UPI003ED863AA